MTESLKREADVRHSKSLKIALSSEIASYILKTGRSGSVNLGPEQTTPPEPTGVSMCKWPEFPCRVMSVRAVIVNECRVSF
jgi:hypothetical protein